MKIRRATSAFLSRDKWPRILRTVGHFLDWQCQLRYLSRLYNTFRQLLAYHINGRSIPVGHPQVGTCIIRCSTSTNPASLIRLGSRRGTLRSFKPSRLSKYRALHWLRAWSTKVRTLLVANVSHHTTCQGSIVGLHIVVHFHHLAPTSRPYDTQYIANVVQPPIGMDSGRHHLAVYKIEVICRKAQPNGNVSPFLVREV